MVLAPGAPAVALIQLLVSACLKCDNETFRVSEQFFSFKNVQLVKKRAL